jgi:hypothetical protein
MACVGPSSVRTPNKIRLTNLFVLFPPYNRPLPARAGFPRMAALFRGYLGLLQRHTLLTQMVLRFPQSLAERTTDLCAPLQATGAFAGGLADVINQQCIEKRGWREHEVSGNTG